MKIFPIMFEAVLAVIQITSSVLQLGRFSDEAPFVVSRTAVTASVSPQEVLDRGRLGALRRKHDYVDLMIYNFQPPSVYSIGDLDRVRQRDGGNPDERIYAENSVCDNRFG